MAFAFEYARLPEQGAHMNAIFQSLGPSLHEAVEVLLRVAVQGAVLAWGLVVGWIISCYWFGKPSWTKTMLLALPLFALIASFLAFYRFKFMPDSRETEVEAIQNAMATFFIVVLTLWIGCVGGMLWEKIKPEFQKKRYEEYKANHGDNISKTQ